MSRLPLNAFVHHSRTSSRPGIILLVVLGMLTLFSMLGVSYLVFTNQQRAAAFNISRAEQDDVDSRDLLDLAVDRILVGSNGPDSSLWGHDLLGDLFGSRDAVESFVTPPNQFQLTSLDCAPEALLGNTDTTNFSEVGIPQVIRFASNLYFDAELPYRRNDVQQERRYPEYRGTFTATPVDTRFPVDDALNDRLLTFQDGPLAGLTFPILRSFGDHRGTPQANRGRETLSGQVYLDIREHLDAAIEIDGTTRLLEEWLNPNLSPGFSVHRLFYQDVITAANITTSPPQPYGEGRFYINGRMLNGPGLGWDLSRTDLVTTSGTDFNLHERVSVELNATQLRNRNGTITPTAPDLAMQGTNYESGTGADVPVAMQGHYARHRLSPDLLPTNAYQAFARDLPPGDTDEPYDAADYNNLWLSHFPNDAQLGEPTPSFVRPALIQWILNQQSGTNLNSLSTVRRQQILRALQRSTLRPLPIVDDPEVPPLLSDRGDGVLAFSYERFTGSNNHPAFSTPISMLNPSGAEILQLAQALAGDDFDGDGILDSWDVDNNGDGINDSLWIDAGLPVGEDFAGRLYKPMVSYMIEDLSGRVNVNLAGNLLQGRGIIDPEIRGAIQHDAPVSTPMTTSLKAPAGANQYNTTDGTLSSVVIPTGVGFGPADIDVRGLFNGQLASNSAAPDRIARGPQRLIRDRLKSWSTSNGFVSSTSPLAANVYIASGELIDPLTATGNDFRGALRDPLTANLHDYREAQGYPLDKFGRASMAMDASGNLVVARASAPVEYGGSGAVTGPGDANDDPYEFEPNSLVNPDTAYLDTELMPILNFESIDRDMIASRLVDLINEYHDAVPGSAAQRDQLDALMRILADSMTTRSNTVTNRKGILPTEWQDSSADIDELRTAAVGDLTAANSAVGPEQLIYETLNAAVLALPAGQRDQARNALLWELIPSEVLGGKRMNLNRPFGNGVNDDDDNGDGHIATFRGTNLQDYADVIDDPEEIAVVERQLRYDATTGPANTNWTSTRGDVTPGEPDANGTGVGALDVSSRAVFARHLYVLAMFLTRDATQATGGEFPFPYDTAGTGPPTTLAAPNDTLTFAEEYRAWKIAQWAINVADFRDPDAIMTRFDYDPDPYDGWDVYNVGSNRTYRTVWGLENPELTLEESLAFHDRRVRDTDRDPTTGKVLDRASSSLGTDNDPDQYEVPEGSLFLEIRSTRSPATPQAPSSDADLIANPMAFPPELYVNRGTVTNPDWRLNINAEAPDQNPVWRIAITEYHDASTRPESCPDFLLQPNGADAGLNELGVTKFNTLGAATLDRDSATLDPNRPRFFGGVVASTPIDRVIWLSGRDPDPDDNGVVDVPVPPDSRAPGKIFYNRSGAATDLAPGQIAVIAPRLNTSLGTGFYNEDGDLCIAADGTPQVDTDKFRSKQRLSLTMGNQISIFPSNMTDPTTDYLQPEFDSTSGAVNNATAAPIVTIIAQSNPPTAWNTRPETRDRAIGLNVSEPYEVLAATGLTARSYYREPTERLSDIATPVNYPYTSWHNFDTLNGQLPDTPFDGESYAELRRALGPTNCQRTGTWNHFKTAYLQRLADPTQPYNAATNPYISVDYISIDLTVFNGSEDNSDSIVDSGGMTQWPDPNDPDPYGSAPTERFASRYKSGTGINVDLTDATSQVTNFRCSVNTIAPAETPHAAAPAVLPPMPVVPVALFRCELNITTDVSAAGSAAAALPLAQTHCTTLGWTNQSYGRRWSQAASANAAMTPFVGLPFEPWFSNPTWLNRSFATPNELALVPTSAPGRLSFEFADASVNGGLPTTADRYDDSNSGAPATYDETTPRRFDFNQRFTHLFNYFSSSSNQFTGANASPNFWRLLDWVEVPPPFDFDADFISPEASPLETTSNNPPLLVGEQPTLPPNSNFPTFYDTAATNAYIDANPLSWNLANPGTSLDRSFNANNGSWISVTAGAGVTNGFWTNHVALAPFRPPFSFRAKPFRSGLINLNTIKNNRVYRSLMWGISSEAERNLNTGNGAFWPEFHNSRRGYTTPSSYVTGGQLRPSLNHSFPTQQAGVFQPANHANIRPQISTWSTATKEPLDSTLLRATDPTATPSVPLFQRTNAAGTPQEEPISSRRSALHDQLGQSRLANLTTDQSNVFAVWITVGLFELDGSTMSVGDELGSDTGNVQRFRAFHIIDRSVPVEYRPGESRNTSNVIQLSRYSE